MVVPTLASQLKLEVCDHCHESQVDQDDRSADADAKPAYHDELLHVCDNLGVGKQNVSGKAHDQLVHHLLPVHDSFLKGARNQREACHDNCCCHGGMNLHESPVTVNYEHKD